MCAKTLELILVKYDIFTLFVDFSISPLRLNDRLVVNICWKNSLVFNEEKCMELGNSAAASLGSPCVVTKCLLLGTHRPDREERVFLAQAMVGGRRLCGRRSVRPCSCPHRSSKGVYTGNGPSV